VLEDDVVVFEVDLVPAGAHVVQFFGVFEGELFAVAVPRGVEHEVLYCAGFLVGVVVVAVVFEQDFRVASLVIHVLLQVEAVNGYCKHNKQ
jgi:hypothetical protein